MERNRPNTRLKDRPTALFLTPEAPYPPVGGGASRAASLLDYLGRRYEVDVIAFREEGEPDPGDWIPAGLVRRVRVINMPRHSRRLLPRVGRNLGRLIYGRPPLNDRFGGFGDEVLKSLPEGRYSLAMVEHFWCAPYWQQVAPRSDRVILDLHNVESALLAGSAGVAPWPVARAFRRFHTACLRQERRWLPKFDLLLTASDEDARRVDEIAPGVAARVFPNTIPRIPAPVRSEEDVVIFSGNLGYHPNITAVRYFAKHIWPLLRRRRPGLVWRLIGKNPETVRKFTAGDPRIELIGPVEDAIQALASAKVAVAPLLEGSGTRVKILEAWAATTAVVSTTVGAEGLTARDGEHLLLADDPERFAEAVLTLLESETARRRVGESGRGLYEREFTWESAWSRLEKIGI